MLKANYTPPQHPRTKAHRHPSVRRAVAVDISPSPVVPCRRVVRLLIIYVLKSPSPCVCVTDGRNAIRTDVPSPAINVSRHDDKGTLTFRARRNERRRTYARWNRYVRTHTPNTHGNTHRDTHMYNTIHTHIYKYIYIYRLKLISSTLLRWRYNARNLCSSVARKLLAHKRTNKI